MEKKKLAIITIACLLLISATASGMFFSQSNKNNFKEWKDPRPTLKVFIPREIEMAIVGNTCTSGSCCTFDNLTVEKDNDFKAVMVENSGDYEESMVTTVGHTKEETKQIKKEVREMVNEIRKETGGALNLKVEFIELYGKAGMGGLGKFNFCGLISGPQADGMAELQGRYLDKKDDFILYAHPPQYSMGWAGISWWAGEIYSVPYAVSQAINKGVYKHELTHGIDFALDQVMYVEDIYKYGYPDCGKGDTNTLKWFPNPDTCTKDPDYTDCGLSACYSGPDTFYTHIFGEHYPKWVKLNGNYCTNRVKDFDEEGIDCGGAYCSPC